MKKPHYLLAAVLLTAAVLAGSVAGCAPGGGDASNETITFTDPGWDTATFMAYFEAFIIEHGYGYNVEIESTTNVVGLKCIELGEIDVHPEVAPMSLQEPLDALVETGRGVVIGPCYGPQVQGWYVPTFMIEGDASRGIEPMTPDLESVFDMPEYWQLFRDPADPEKGVFYSCIPGWQCQETNAHKMIAYGLDEYYNIVTPGSDIALATSMIAAIEKGEPWFGYYWEPTWVLAQVDVTRLEEPPYDEDLWNPENHYACAYPDEYPVIVGAASLQERAPDVWEFLERVDVPVEVLNTMLLYLQESGNQSSEITDWFLTRYEDVWTEWVSDEVADNVRAAM
ncbi:MAG TPA: ABC transporter substrate-binding protein [Dehalococcoidia bacterium]|nr:ABC transporter substrate-binding protein [Dehalococcoidia bacterium]